MEQKQRLSAYRLVPLFGVGNDGYSSFGVEVYEASRDEEAPEVPYQYLVAIDRGGRNEHVVVPSFLADLHAYQPIKPFTPQPWLRAEWRAPTRIFGSEAQDAESPQVSPSPSQRLV